VNRSTGRTAIAGIRRRSPVQNHPHEYSYARVSTDGQSIDAQVRQLKAAGARQVFREVASGAKTDRAQLRRVLARLEAGVPEGFGDLAIFRFPSYYLLPRSN
jgi:predicted site-specific integrase-resolvase